MAGLSQVLRKSIVVALVPLLLCCRGPESSSVAPKPSAAHSAAIEDTDHQNFLLGLEGIGKALDRITVAVTALGTVDLGGVTHQARGDVATLLDGVGASLADIPPLRPDEREFADQFAEYDEIRLQGIAAANDALHELADARGILVSLSEDLPLEGPGEAMGRVMASLDEAEEDLRSAIGHWGGTVELNPVDSEAMSTP